MKFIRILILLGCIGNTLFGFATGFIFMGILFLICTIIMGTIILTIDVNHEEKNINNNELNEYFDKKNKQGDIKYIASIREKDIKYIDYVEKQDNNELVENKAKKEYHTSSPTIVINFNGLIIFLLIVIIIILLYSNGIFYKFTIITKENINDVIQSSYLKESEKEILMYKMFQKKDNEFYGKMIWQLL